MLSSASELLAMFYLVVHAMISTQQDILELAMVYHIVHPDGRGVDVQELLKGGNSADFLACMTPENGEIYKRIRRELANAYLLNQGEFDIEEFIGVTLQSLADQYRTPDSDITQRIRSTVPELVANWKPTPEQERIYRLAQDLLQDDEASDYSDSDSSCEH